MVLNVIQKTIVIVQLFLIIQIIAHKYVIVVKDEEIFSPCDLSNTYYIDEYLDISNMNFKYLENGSVYFYGETVLIKDVGTGNNPFSIELLKKNRDTWTSTVYNIHRDDLCNHLYDQTELWYSYVRDTPAEEKTCPFNVGRKFSFDVISDMELDIPDPRMAGEYKIQIIINLKELNEVLCANILSEIYRK